MSSGARASPIGGPYGRLVSPFAGLDVHKANVVACVRIVGPTGKVTKQVAPFPLRRTPSVLADWLSAEGVTHVAMESTGVFWKPVFNILEDRFTVLLVNAHHMKQVPGRKTDVKDCEWIAQLLQHGLLCAQLHPAPVCAPDAGPDPPASSAGLG